MAPSNDYMLIPLAFTIIALTIIVRRRWFSPLSKFPGPFLASITRLWYTWVMWRGRQHVVLPKLHQKYGPYVRVAPNEIHVTDPTYVRPIYGTGSQFRKTDFFKVFQGSRNFDLVSERDRQKHAFHKRLVARAYAMSSVRVSEPNIDVTLETLICRINERIGIAFDVSEWLQYWSFDTVGMMTFSRTFGLLDAKHDEREALLQIRRAMDSAAWLGQNPWFYELCQRYVFPITGNFFALANRHQSIRKFAVEQIIDRESRGESAHPDIMKSLLSIHKRKAEFDTTSLQSMATTNIFGGAETTASSLRAVIYYLLKNPACKVKLIEEIDKHCVLGFGQGGNVVSFAQIENMTYLRAVIFEAMRLFPANGIPSGRVVPEDGFEVEGHFMPPGSEITIFSWSFHQREDVFGPDPEVFAPERWLDSSTKDSVERYFFSFGSGARICLGRSLAWLEMTKCVATLFARYDINLSDFSNEWTIDGSFIKGQRNIDVIFQHRKFENAI